MSPFTLNNLTIRNKLLKSQKNIWKIRKNQKNQRNQLMMNKFNQSKTTFKNTNTKRKVTKRKVQNIINNYHKPLIQLTNLGTISQSQKWKKKDQLNNNHLYNPLIIFMMIWSPKSNKTEKKLKKWLKGWIKNIKTWKSWRRLKWKKFKLRSKSKPYLKRKLITLNTLKKKKNQKKLKRKEKLLFQKLSIMKYPKKRVIK